MIDILQTMNDKMEQQKLIDFAEKMKIFKFLREKKSELQKLLLDEEANSEQSLDI
jgi:hypothetical protein